MSVATVEKLLTLRKVIPVLHFGVRAGVTKRLKVCVIIQQLPKSVFGELVPADHSGYPTQGDSRHTLIHLDYVAGTSEFDHHLRVPAVFVASRFEQVGKVSVFSQIFRHSKKSIWSSTIFENANSDHSLVSSSGFPF